MLFSFNKKKIINDLYDKDLVQLTKINDLNFKINQYENEQTNIEKLIKKEKSIISYYTLNDNRYVICLPKYEIYSHSFFFEVYKVTHLYPQEIAKARAYNYNNEHIELQSIDTIVERRQGHASKLLQSIEEIAQHKKIHEIWGRLSLDTSIEIDNLKSFYLKNGYEVSSESFKKTL